MDFRKKRQYYVVLKGNKVTTPNSFKAQQEGRPYQPQMAEDRMRGSGGQSAQQPWAEQPAYRSYEGEAGSQYQQSYPQQFQDQPVQQYQQQYLDGYVQQPPMGQQGPRPKSTATAATLSFLLTSYGAANFYLGRKLQGVGQILLSTLGLICLVVVGILWSATTLDPAFYVFAVITSVIYIAMGCWMLFDLIRIVKKKPPMDRDANGIPLK